MQVHPVAELFPMIPDDELREMAEDIKQNGLDHPIVCQGDILIDGRNRLKACELAGVTPVFQELKKGKDPVKFILSENLKRRHLTTSQRAMIAAEMANLDKGKPSQSKSANLRINDPVPQKQAAKLMNVSERSVNEAKKIKKESPQLAAQVASGEKTVNGAKKEIAAAKPPRKMAKPSPAPDAALVPKMLGQITRFLDEWTAHHKIQNGPAHQQMLRHLSDFQKQFDLTRGNFE